MKLQVIKIHVLNWIKKILLYGAYFTLLFFVLSFGLLEIPSVQKSLISRITTQFSQVRGAAVFTALGSGGRRRRVAEELSTGLLNSLSTPTSTGTQVLFSLSPRDPTMTWKQASRSAGCTR